MNCHNSHRFCRYRLIYADLNYTQRAKDVLRVVEPINTTLDEWVRRGEGSKAYCGIKKKLLTQEAARAAEVILGRW